MKETKGLEHDISALKKEIETIGKENEQLQTTNEVVQITGAESVPLGTLDRYEETHPMDVGLIKVDIEGLSKVFCEGLAEQ